MLLSVLRDLDDHTYGRAMNTSSSLSKIGVPNPVTGSHPSTALKPSVLHPGLLPVVIYYPISNVIQNRMQRLTSVKASGFW
jgi:hypothetical protein